MPRKTNTKVDLKKKKTKSKSKEQSLVFNCSSCAQPQLLIQGKRNILCHPQLQVGVCRECLIFAHADIIPVDDEGYEIYCRWCSELGNLICCDQCKAPYCEECISRNIGSDYYESLSECEEWKCFACDPSSIEDLRELTKAALDHQNYKDPSDLLLEKCSAVFGGDANVNDSDREEIVKERIRLRRNNLNETLKKRKAVKEKDASIISEEEEEEDEEGEEEEEKEEKEKVEDDEKEKVEDDEKENEAANGKVEPGKEKQLSDKDESDDPKNDSPASEDHDSDEKSLPSVNLSEASSKNKRGRSSGSEERDAKSKASKSNKMDHKKKVLNDSDSETDLILKEIAKKVSKKEARGRKETTSDSDLESKTNRKSKKAEKTSNKKRDDSDSDEKKKKSKKVSNKKDDSDSDEKKKKSKKVSNKKDNLDSGIKSRKSKLTLKKNKSAARIDSESDTSF